MVDISPLISSVKTVIIPLSLPWSCFAIVLLGFIIRSLSHSKGKLPPGPRGLPLLGNVFQVPKLQWLRFTEWKDQFGPIFSLNLAGQPVVVLNTHKVTADLLDRRGNIYSDRPRFIMAGEILTGGLLIGLLRYGDLWRKLRRAAHEGLNILASDKYQPLQEREAAALIAGLLRSPEAWDDHLRLSAASTVLSAVYGWPPIESKDHPIVTRINEHVIRFLKFILPGAHLVDIFPVMNRFPSWMAKWKREGLEWHRRDSEMFEGLIDGVREQMRAGDYQPSLSASLIENNERHSLTRKETAWLAGTMFGGGAETTAAALSVFILAMTLYPEVMRKGHAELDAAVGPDRMPTFADRSQLPYVRAIVKEVLRWRPITPLGGPRQTAQDDWYNGYYIPKGTIVLANVWAMNRDPEIFPDYDEFRPERFLDASGQVDFTPRDTRDQGHVSYGFGRRICVGMNIANQTLFIDIASMLWALNIEKAVDAKGVDIIPSRTDLVDEGLAVRPAPFKCKISARSKDVAAAVDMVSAKQVF